MSSFLCPPVKKPRICSGIGHGDEHARRNSSPHAEDPHKSPVHGQRCPDEAMKNKEASDKFLAEWDDKLAQYAAMREAAAARGVPSPPPPWDRQPTPPQPTSPPPPLPVVPAAVPVMLVGNLTQANEFFRAWDCDENVVMQVCPSLPLDAAGCIYQRVMQTRCQNCVVNFPVLQQKSAQAEYLHSKMAQAKQEELYWRNMLSLPWLPIY